MSDPSVYEETVKFLAEKDPLLALKYTCHKSSCVGSLQALKVLRACLAGLACFLFPTITGTIFGTVLTGLVLFELFRFAMGYCALLFFSSALPYIPKKRVKS